MNELVVLVVAFLMEGLAAELALPRLVAEVDAHVRVQCRAAVERLAANGAPVRLLLSVDYLVPAKGARLPEALATDLADERAHAGVDRHVPRQVVVRIERLAALVALEQLVAGRRIARRLRVGVRLFGWLLAVIARSKSSRACACREGARSSQRLMPRLHLRTEHSVRSRA